MIYSKIGGGGIKAGACSAHPAPSATPPPPAAKF